MPAVEIMMATSAVKNLIRDGKIYQIPNTMLTQARMGMVLLDHALVKLYRKGTISLEHVQDFCNDAEEVNKLIGRSELI